jgi:hypothetical protein
VCRFEFGGKVTPRQEPLCGVEALGTVRKPGWRHAICRPITGRALDVIEDGE